MFQIFLDTLIRNQTEIISNAFSFSAFVPLLFILFKMILWRRRYRNQMRDDRNNSSDGMSNNMTYYSLGRISLSTLPQRPRKKAIAVAVVLSLLLIGSSAITESIDFKPINKSAHLTLPEIDQVATNSVSEKSKNSASLLIFLHGWNGDDSTWKKFRELAKSDLKLIDLNVSTWSIPYTTYMIRRNLNISDLSNLLEEKLHSERVYKRFKKIAIISHSMGGLVARQVVIQATLAGGTPEPIGLLVSIGSPHAGTHIASLVKALGVSKELVTDMKPNSGFLNELETNWKKLENRTGTRPITRCYGSLHDKIVDVESAIHNCDRSVKYQNWGHREIVRPVDTVDDRYKLPISHIKDYFEVPSRELSTNFLSPIP